MKIIKTDCSLNFFDFWAGGLRNVQYLSYNDLEQMTFVLEDIYPEGLTETQINDIFWFDFDFVMDSLGYKWDEENDKLIEKTEEDYE